MTRGEEANIVDRLNKVRIARNRMAGGGPGDYNNNNRQPVEDNVRYGTFSETGSKKQRWIRTVLGELLASSVDQHVVCHHGFLPQEAIVIDYCSIGRDISERYPPLATRWWPESLFTVN